MNGQRTDERNSREHGEKEKDCFFHNFGEFTVRNLTLLPQYLLSFLTPILDGILLLVSYLAVAVLLLLSLLFAIFKLLRFDKAITALSIKYAKGQSMVQWAASDLLTQDHSAEFQALKDVEDSENFSLPVAKSLLLFSSIVYESTTKITDITQDWPFKRKELVGTRTLVEIFHSTEKDVIVVAFRGTSPLDLSEWLLDFNIRKESGNPNLFGYVHAGFKQRLFSRSTPFWSSVDSSSNNHTSTGDEKRNITETNLYSIIMDHLRTFQDEKEKKGRNKRSGSQPKKLWITGHSLGAAIATLFYARLVQSRELPADFQLMGAYTFGCPRSGDYDFKQYTETSEKRFSDGKKPTPLLWRVVNALDIVPRGPLGLESFTNPEFFKNTIHGVMDYSHLGRLVQLHHTSPIDFNRGWGRNLWEFVKDYLWYWGWFGETVKALFKLEVTKALSFLLPSVISDHIPAFYYYNLRT